MTDDSEQDWRAYLTDVRPLTRVQKKRPPSAHKTGPRRAETVHSMPPVFDAPARAVTPPQLTRKEQRAAQKGTMGLDGRMDLHGMTQDEAFTALCRFCAYHHQIGHRRLLVITGRGREGASVLRARLPQWCAAMPLAPLILSLSVAAPKWGGSGAFLLVLSRRKA